MPTLADDFPALACCTRPDTSPELARCTLYDVKFWPWSDKEEQESVFATTGGRNLIVFSTKQDGAQPFEILRWWQLDESSSLNSICWTKTAEGRPLLCAAGSNPRAIVIFDIEYDEPIRILLGHGKAISDLQISPLSPDILVSASEDYTVRIWNLGSKHEKRPCRAILGGQGHKQPLLTLDFHSSGRWLLTGAMDTAVALWAVPPLEELESADREEPSVSPYPCFISQDIHANFVDCVKWYGDCILSRAARSDDDGGDKAMRRNEILLWVIDGFHAGMSHPERPAIPYPSRSTRSAFPHSERSRGFERLLTFETMNTARFYLRFGLLHKPDMRPILVMGNEMSKFLFWDLQRCEEGEMVVEKSKGKRKGKGKGKKAITKGEAKIEIADHRGELKNNIGKASKANDDTSVKAFTSNNSKAATLDVSRKAKIRSLTDNPMKPLPPQHVEVPRTTLLQRNSYFATSQLGWSPDGKWLVGVGDHGMMVVFSWDHEHQG